MPQVSRRRLPSTTWNQIFELFLHAFSQISIKSEISNYIYDLLSPTERIMLSKRLAIALMLSKQHSYDSIKDKLKVSTATISKVQRQMIEGKGGIQIAIQKILNRQTNQILWEKIKNLLDTAPPSYYKSDWGKRKYKREQKIDQIKSSF